MNSFKRNEGNIFKESKNFNSDPEFIYDEEPLLDDSDSSFSNKEYKKESWLSDSEEEKKKEFWFVSHLGFEQYENKKNRLIMSLRKWSSEKPKVATVYLDHSVFVSTEVIYYYSHFINLLSKIKKDPELSKYPVKAFLSYERRNNKAALESIFKDFEFEVDNLKSYGILINVPNDRRILAKLEKLGFQTKNLNKSIRRQLQWMYRKIVVSPTLEMVFDKVETLNLEYDRIKDLIKEFYPSKGHDPIISTKRTRALNEFREFFNNQYKISDFSNPAFPDLKKRYSLIFKLVNLNPSLSKQIEDKFNYLFATLFSVNQIVKGLDNENSISFNPDTCEFEIVLKSRISNNPFNTKDTEPEGMKVEEERLPYSCWKSLSTCFIDIEKPMWKTDEERQLLQKISELRLELNDPNSKRDAAVLMDEIKQLTERLILHTKEAGDIDLTEDRFKEQISRVMIHIRRENGSVLRQYFKLRSNAKTEKEIKEINGFEVRYFDSEHELVEAVISTLKHEKPYRLVGHVIPYDLKEIRESARKNKTKRFEIAVKKKEPRLWRRGFYQKITMAAQEILDTHRLASVWFPYLKLNVFDLSHKLADVANFIYREKRRMGLSTVLDSEFHKIATHDQLKELEIKAINGDINAEQILDFYSTHDIDPLIEIFDFEPLLRTLYSASLMVPHISISDVAFSPTSMDEIFHMREWSIRHSQLYYGYKEKKREDERQIFKRRLNEYMKRQFSDEGISQFSPGRYKDVYLTYFPLELLLSKAIMPSNSNWSFYFNNLHKDNIIRIAQLQYPKYFLRRNIHLDYYLYRKENDILEQMERQLNISHNELLELFGKYYYVIGKEDGTILMDPLDREMRINQSLTREYYKAYSYIKDKFRSFIISLETINPKASREIKLYINKTPGRRENTDMLFQFFNYFELENSDLISLYNLPEKYSCQLADDSKKMLAQFRKAFNRFKDIEGKIKSILSKPENSFLTEKISAENLMFAFNQFQIKTFKFNQFLALYGIPPDGDDSFRKLINNSYAILGEWIKKNKITVLGAKGDYIFLQGKEIDFSDSPLIPIYRFNEINLVDSKTNLELFE